MDIRIIASELFTLAIIFILFVNIFTALTALPKIIIFGGVSFLGVLLVRSILREVRYREQLQVAYEGLKVLDTAKSEFISMASHQLRTPLSAIKGYISMAIEGSYGRVADKLGAKLHNVFVSTERLIKIVNNLLSVSRIEMGKLETEKKPIDIAELVESCCEELRIEAEKKGLELIFEKPQVALPKIVIDELKIRQVVLNLVDNAIRYTQKGEIRVGLRKIDSTIQISVKDTGAGLTEKEKKDIFKGFFRGSAGINYFVEGAGLGLYVAKKFLELHHGRTWAESEGKEKGSVFYVELPAG